MQKSTQRVIEYSFCLGEIIGTNPSMAFQVLSFDILYREQSCGERDAFQDLHRWKPSL